MPPHYLPESPGFQFEFCISWCRPCGLALQFSLVGYCLTGLSVDDPDLSRNPYARKTGFTDPVGRLPLP